MHQAPSTPPRQHIWIAAKEVALEWWDNPPAMLFWLLLTAGMVGVLKLVGL